MKRIHHIDVFRCGGFQEASSRHFSLFDDSGQLF